MTKFKFYDSVYNPDNSLEIKIDDCLNPSTNDTVVISLLLSKNDTEDGLLIQGRKSGTVQQLTSEDPNVQHYKIEHKGPKQVLSFINYMLFDLGEACITASSFYNPFIIYRISLGYFPEAFPVAVVNIIAHAKIEKVIEMILAHEFVLGCREKLSEKYGKKPVSKSIKNIFEKLIQHQNMSSIKLDDFEKLYQILIEEFNGRIPNEAMLDRHRFPINKANSLSIFGKREPNTVDLYINILKTLEESGLVQPESEKVKNMLQNTVPLPQPLVDIIKKYISP